MLGCLEIFSTKLISLESSNSTSHKDLGLGQNADKFFAAM
jgi:hypothetical protein